MRPPYGRARPPNGHVSPRQAPTRSARPFTPRTLVGPERVADGLLAARQALRAEGSHELAGGGGVLQRGAADGPLPAPLVARRRLVAVQEVAIHELGGGDHGGHARAVRPAEADARVLAGAGVRHERRRQAAVGRQRVEQLQGAAAHARAAGGRWGCGRWVGGMAINIDTIRSEDARRRRAGGTGRAAAGTRPRT